MVSGMLRTVVPVNCIGRYQFHVEVNSTNLIVSNRNVVLANTENNDLIWFAPIEGQQNLHGYC